MLPATRTTAITRRATTLRQRSANTAPRMMIPRAIAMKCNLRAGDGAVAFKIAYDEAYARFSPGVLLEIEQIERLHRTCVPAPPESPVVSMSRNVAVRGSKSRRASTTTPTRAEA